MFRVTLSILALVAVVNAAHSSFAPDINGGNPANSGKYSPSYVETFQPAGRWILTFIPQNNLATVAAIGPDTNSNTTTFNANQLRQAYIQTGDTVWTSVTECGQTGSFLITLNTVPYCVLDPWQVVWGRVRAYVGPDQANTQQAGLYNYGAARAFPWTSRILKPGHQAGY